MPGTVPWLDQTCQPDNAGRLQQGAILAVLASTTCIAVLAVVKPF